MDCNIDMVAKEASVLFAKSVFDKESILAASYWLSKKYSLKFDDSAVNLRLVVTLLDGLLFDEAEVRRDLEALYANVLDEQLRIMLEAKSGKIRELIVRHAFAPIDLKKEASLR